MSQINLHFYLLEELADLPLGGGCRLPRQRALDSALVAASHVPCNIIPRFQEDDSAKYPIEINTQFQIDKILEIPLAEGAPEQYNSIPLILQILQDGGHFLAPEFPVVRALGKRGPALCADERTILSSGQGTNQI